MITSECRNFIYIQNIFNYRCAAAKAKNQQKIYKFGVGSWVISGRVFSSMGYFTPLH